MDSPRKACVEKFYIIRIKPVENLESDNNTVEIFDRLPPELGYFLIAISIGLAKRFALAHCFDIPIRLTGHKQLQFSQKP